MSEDSILLISFKKREIGLITVFITSSLIVIICAHEELIRPNEAALLLNNLIVVFGDPLIVVNAVTGISTSGYTIN
jgi:hypothetical protein